MTTAALSYSRIQNKIQSRVGSVSLPSVNWKIVFFASFLACSALLVFYAFQINDLTKGTYLINNYEKEINSLARENGNLEVSFAESGFLGQVLAKTQEMNFLKTTSVKYIQILNASFASVNRDNMR